VTAKCSPVRGTRRCNVAQIHLGDDADDQEIRALVAETAGASFEARDARRHVDAHAKHRAKVVDEIASLERRQDELLDRM